MYSPFEMDDSAYSDCTSSSHSVYDRTSSNSPFDANATLRGLPNKPYFEPGQQIAEDAHWQASRHSHEGLSKSSLLNLGGNVPHFADPSQPWSAGCYQPRMNPSSSASGQPTVHSYDVAFWPISQDGIIVRGVDPEPLITEFPTSEELDAQSIYLHPKLSYPQPISDCDGNSLANSLSRRLSDASTSISADLMPYDGLLSSQESNSASALSFNDQFGGRVGNPTHSCASTTNPSPLPSPRNMTDLVRVPSRGKASPSPRQNSRLTPYPMEGRNKRWSTGMNLPGSGPFGGYGNLVTSIASTLELANGPNMSEAGILHTLSECSPGQCESDNLIYPQYNHSVFHANRVPTFLPARPLLESQIDHPFPAAQHAYLRMLHSSNDSHYHYGDICNPPDLYAALSEEQLDPPEEDMNPEDPDMKPHEQELRFEGDLYTPKWVRNHGNKREGWCGICKPGRWLVLKNSAFWYDKSFTHGISAATGQAFMEPQDVRRVDGNPDVWEGLCHSCHEWISLVSNKKKGTTWFRHAYKCHVHQAPKIKGTPKRRIRDSRPGTARSSESV